MALLMKTKIQIAVLFIFCCNCFSLVAQKMNGVSFVASRDSVSEQHIVPVMHVNANYVSLMPFGFIRDVSTPQIVFNSNRQWFGERERGIRQYAKAFHAKGIKVMLKPQLWVSRGVFTGKIAMSTDDDWKVLERSYEDFILTYAATAQQINAEILCIGTELEQFVVQRPQFWEQLILKIRKVYSGKLTYAANWDEFTRVPFWGALDYIGVDAYFPVSELKTPSVSDFEAGWQPHKAVIKTQHLRYQKPVLFTEFGYRSIDYTGKEPWDAKNVQGAINLIAQSNGLQAIYNQFWNEPWFAGGFVWKWFHVHAKVGGASNNRFTPQNKPAEERLKKLFAH